MAKRGSGGILLHIKETLSENVLHLQNSSVDDRIWIKFKSTKCGKDTHMHVYCCFCYKTPMDSTAMTQ